VRFTRSCKAFDEPAGSRLSPYWAAHHYAAGSRPSSAAALFNASKSVMPSETVLTIRCAIFAFVPGVRCEWSMRSTAMFSADLMSITSSGLNFGSCSFCISGCRLPFNCDRWCVSAVTTSRRNIDYAHDVSFPRIITLRGATATRFQVAAVQGAATAEVHGPRD
jgi:hypothetical protein